jgi:cysteinyl-tRNA synthetase
VTLKLYNTRTRKKEEFRPIDPGNVRMYICGPTVYDYAHIGNARPVIVFDVLYRLLRHLYGAEHVTYVRNITDVDDKINARAVESYPDMPPEQAIRKLTEETAAQFHQDVAALGCLPPTNEPRATEYIAEMREMITRLHEANVAYVAEEHVLFSVAAYGELKDVPRYGSLARRSVDEMIAGARVEVAPYKRDPMDFVLWKPSKGGEPGWPSPLNIQTPGRPGWHLECSAMSKALLGDEFDIHGGGIDLMFPHHENEVAQSCGANHTRKMANVWMHNGFLQVEGQKMSKSLGNFFTINELLNSAKFGDTNWPGSVLRVGMFTTHYRQPIDWTVNNLDATWHVLEEFYFSAAETQVSRPSPEILDALQDDLNTPLVLSALHAIRKRIRQKQEGEAAHELAQNLNFLGIDLSNFGVWYDAERRRVLAKVGQTVSAAAYAKDGSRAVAVERTKKSTLGRAKSPHAVAKKSAAAYTKGEPRSAAVEDTKKTTLEHAKGGSRAPAVGNTKQIDDLLDARNAARKAKNWAEADRIRDDLAAMGIALKDTKDPKTGEIVTTWEIAR